MTELTLENKTNTTKHTKCYHCGEICEDDIVSFEEKSFCCQGCQTVFQILQENDLCNYYDLEQMPGIQLKNRDFGDKFAFLDNEDIAKELLTFADEKLQKSILHLPQVHCSSCIWLLENLYKLKEGITYSRVNFSKKEISISFNPKLISFREVAELLTSIGYEPKINLQDLHSHNRKAESRSLLYKIGLTAFCFGNIMLLSFPDYLALEDWMGEVFYKNVFGYLNILLALPIFFYSSADYFRSALKSLRTGIINLDVPISLGILALFGRSIFEILSQTGAGYMDSLAGLLFFLLVGKWVQQRTYESLSFERDYKSYFPLAVRLKKNDTISTKRVTDLEKNDTIIIRNQELIPADSLLLSKAAYIDYSFVTGEAEPIHKKQGEYIYAGGRQVGRSIELLVQKKVEQSYLTQLWNSEAFTHKQSDKIHRNVALFSKYFTLGTLSVAFASLAFWFFVNPSLMWNAFTAVLIVACPCALALSTPYALGNTMRIFGRNAFYLKNSDVVAYLSDIDYLVFDKTGTITQSQESKISFIGEGLNQKEKRWIKSLVRHSTHPLSKKINDYLAKAEVLDLENFEEVEGKGIQGNIQGHNLKIGSGLFVEAESLDENSLQTRVYIKINSHIRGYFAIKNQYREGLKGLISDLQKHYHTALITGDNEAEKDTLKSYFGQNTILKFNQKPKDKLEFIKKLQEKGKTVLMLGDGLNDAGALQQSDIGIAITEDTTSFSPACEAILDAKAFIKIASLLKFSKVALKVVRASFILSLMYNLFGVAFAVSGNLSPILAAVLMPTSSITVVAFVVLATNFLGKRKKLLS